VDDAITVSPNLVAGANAEGFHVLNVNYGRDFEANIIADIAMARDGDMCPECGAALESSRGVEVGNIFQLGTRYSEAMHCLFQDADGNVKAVIMGSYGIGLGRLLACVAEEHHDDMGLCLPISVAPYHVHLIALKGDAKIELLADQIYMQLQAGGIEVIYDDRSERPGVKFMDADLIGVPLRITVGDRALARGGVELKHRRNKASEIVSIESVDDRVNATLSTLWQNLTSVEMRNL
jgi:prolyl-tRNA synthetase